MQVEVKQRTKEIVTDIEFEKAKMKDKKIETNY